MLAELGLILAGSEVMKGMSYLAVDFTVYVKIFSLFYQCWLRRL